MSSVFEEILTSSVGFIIAVVILAAAVAGGLYGYWAYANHVTLQNYLWPVAEVLPYQGEYFLGIVNTGHEPFTIKQIYLKGGGVLAPNQAANPNLNWCSVSNTKLMHNQWWCGMVNQLPVAVMVCSALDPQVCSVVPVHGWQVVTFSQPNQPNNYTFSLLPNCPVTVIVYDPYNATWQVTWSSKSGLSGSRVGSTTDKWCVIPNSPGVINFQASVTNNPNLYICWVNPGSTQVNYTGAPVGAVFNVECLPAFVYVNVLNDTFNAGWEVKDWVASISGSSNVYNAILPVDVQPNPFGSGYIVWDDIWAWITSNPNGYTCTIKPSYMRLDGNYFGAKLNFTVSCSVAPISVNVYYSGLSAWYPPGWVITWSGAADGSANSNEYPPNIVFGVGVESSFTIYPSRNGTVYFTANITSMPSIFKSCTISPATTTAIPGQTVTFTINCVPKYIAYVTVDSCPGPLWYVTSSVDEIMGMTSVTNEPIALGGYVDTLSAGIVWGASGITPSSIQVTNGSHVTFTVNCGGGNNGGGNNNYFVYVTVTNDTLGAGWQVSSSVKSISGSGNVNNEQLPIGGQTDTLTASITSNPSGYTCTISPSSEQVTSGNSYTFTVSCVQSSQTQPPPPPSNYFCIINPSASDNVGGESGAYVRPSTTQYIPPGQSVLFTWAIQNNPVQYNGQAYYFNNWVVTLNGKTVVNEQYSGVSYNFTCPSNLSSNQTYTLSGTAYYWERYLKAGGGNTFNVDGNGTFPITSKYTTAYFTWSDPLFISGSWSINYTSDAFTISVTLNDFYSEIGTATGLSASTTLAIAGPPGYICSINSISPTSGSITSAQASNWLPTSAQVSITCVPQGKGW